MNNLIYIVDDEEDILELVSLHLKKSLYKVKSFSDGRGFFSGIRKTLPDLIVLDLMLPDMDGIEICKELKKDPKFAPIPIIMLTAKADESDKLVGLEFGADDYITKPFSPRELVARIKVVLKRTHMPEMNNDLVTGGTIKLDSERYKVFVQDKATELTTTEFNILRFLIESKGKVVSRDKILSYLWGDDKAVLDRTVDVHIKKLRDKLGKAGKYIKNIRGAGYYFEE
jgi:DNA-binding response OmpR family regulator